MLVTSKDLFWVALAFAILWIGIAAGFACFYSAMILRNVWLVSKMVRKKIEAVGKVVSAFKGKVENTASYMPPLIDGVTKLVEAFAEKKAAQAAKGKRKK